MTAGERPPLRLVHARPRTPVDAISGLGEDAVTDDGDERAADDEAVGPRAPHPPTPRFVVVALVAFQLLGALAYLGKYIELTRGGGVSPTAAILAVPGSLALYAGALALAWRPRRGRAPFLAAAVALSLSVPAWGVSYGWTWPMAFGAMLGLAGAWFARDETVESAGDEPAGDDPPF